MTLRPHAIKIAFSFCTIEKNPNEFKKGKEKREVPREFKKGGGKKGGSSRERAARTCTEILTISRL
jgi:hypothetical protein